MLLLFALLLFGPADSVFVPDDSVVEVRNKIVAAYQQSLDALARGDADAALQIDTEDWVSITPGQPELRRQERDEHLRQNVDSQKPPAGWVAIWKPDYERNGTSTGIQIYDVKVEGKTATVLCLVGSTKDRVWTGSQVRDIWIETLRGWKRSRHEKLTVNERLVDGKRPPG
jgi:ketosteroid isomerase-like protein